MVDDGSTDGSAEVLRTLAPQDARIRIIIQDNAGPSAARNRGIREAQGELIAFLDADDSWHPEFQAKMVNALDRDPGAGMAYCGWQNLGLTGGRGEPFVPPDYEVPEKIELLLAGCRWPIHAAAVRETPLRKGGGFNEQLESSEDYDLWLRVASGTRVIRVPEVLAFYHHHGGERLTKNRARLALNYWRAQRSFVRARPEVAERLGARRIGALTHGELLRRGYECYWRRDLPAARVIFRQVMRCGYGNARDWLYMLPSLLPESLHRLLLKARERLMK